MCTIDFCGRCAERNLCSRHTMMHHNVCRSPYLHRSHMMRGQCCWVCCYHWYCLMVDAAHYYFRSVVAQGKYLHKKKIHHEYEFEIFFSIFIRILSASDSQDHVLGWAIAGTCHFDTISTNTLTFASHVIVWFSCLLIGWQRKVFSAQKWVGKPTTIFTRSTTNEIDVYIIGW